MAEASPGFDEGVYTGSWSSYSSLFSKLNAATGFILWDDADVYVQRGVGAAVGSVSHQPVCGVWLVDGLGGDGFDVGDRRSLR